MIRIFLKSISLLLFSTNALRMGAVRGQDAAMISPEGDIYDFHEDDHNDVRGGRSGMGVARMGDVEVKGVVGVARMGDVEVKGVVGTGWKSRGWATRSRNGVAMWA